MLDFPIWRRVFLWSITLALMVAALPTVASLAGLRWPAGLPAPQVNLGLDLAGGSHIMLEADTAQVARQRIEALEEGVRQSLRNASERIAISEVSTAGGRLSFRIDDPARIEAARAVLNPLVIGTGSLREWSMTISPDGRVVITPTAQGLDAAVNNAMDSATEVVRRRIDALGTREPTIIRQGATRIVVQVPGLQDPEALKELLGQTAELEFKLVDITALPSDLAQGIAPPGSEIVPYAAESDFPGQVLAVRRLGGIRGSNLTNAQATVDPQTNENVVTIQFDSEGAARFAQLTSQNVNRPFAIILDGEVLSAPNINEPILGGNAQISGGFTAESANQLAIQLRSGALPVDLRVVEESTVSAELGADSIERGVLALALGAVLLFAFILLTYGRFGVYACAALLINMLMILGVMAVMNTTLTLPGIAGFVLTIGAAVDANVLINERIREERKRGRRVVQAVEMGYREASRAIFDANITNAIAAVLMFMFGSGPIRGFAVVLMIGIVTSVFTAVTLTRMWVAGWLRAKRPNEIVI